ncbi:2'-5' RNA ligase family protein [Streptomyces sp. NPDC048202]|uniref:2'-5' RNA ligase family protein n=1 Tax=Streptomyces sp. NPDC048202 TaxID=3365514 RepID=UPI00371C5C89
MVAPVFEESPIGVIRTPASTGPAARDRNRVAAAPGPAAIREVIGRHRPFEARFERCGRFPGILYLAPDPDAPFRRLTEAVAERWPETPPFGGQFDEIVPHLTIAQGQDDAVLEEAEGRGVVEAYAEVAHQR